MNRIVRILAVLGTAAGLVAAPATAQAASTTEPSSAVKAPAHHVLPASAVAGADAGINATIHFTTPYLATGYGPLAQATLIDGATGRPGLYSPITRTFTSSSPSFPVALEGWFDGSNVCASDGVCGYVVGYAVLGTPYGGAIFSTQFRGGLGRWGAWNIHTGLFYPSGDWLPTA